MKKEIKIFFIILGTFLLCFFLPVGKPRFDNAVLEGFQLIRWYAREHVLFCLIPAFFIAGAIAAFISQRSVIQYFGSKANKFVSYGVASVSGTILAVCSCTVLPLFASIYKMGAGIGPATAFLYSGPAINALAIILTARVLGLKLGIARAVGAILFSIIIGLSMHFIFRNEEKEKSKEDIKLPDDPPKRPLWKNSLVMAMMLGVLIFANWSISGEFIFGVACCEIPNPAKIEKITGVQTSEDQNFVYIKDKKGAINKREKRLIKTKSHTENPIYLAIHDSRFIIAGFFLLALGTMLYKWFTKKDLNEWIHESWLYAKQILPLLLIGVFIAGMLLGRVGHEGIIPSEWIKMALGGNSLLANFFASFAGAFMYFATLTEIPILQGLIANGMGKGPALALLLAGPALSLPNMIVVYSVMGLKKTVSFVSLVIIMATFSGMLFGYFF